MARRPTPKQARLLVRIANGEVTATRRDDGDITFRAAATGYGSTPAAVTAAVKPLIVNGWADIPFAESGRVGGAVTLTVGGAQALSDAQTLAEFAALPDVADADHAAEIARAVHVLRHVHGELPTPTRESTETTP